MKNIYFLVTAYSLIWIVLFGYILNLLKKQKHLTKEVDRLKNQMDKK